MKSPPHPWPSPATSTVDWEALAHRALEKHQTPFFLCSEVPIAEALSELNIFGNAPVRHWLSLKTQCLAPLLRAWKE